MVIEDHEVLSAATGGDGETASFFSGYFASQFNCLDKVSKDQTGRFPVTSSRSSKYLMVLYDHDSNAIILEASLTFVVEHLELWDKAPIGELGVEDGVGSDELCFTS